MKRHLVPALAAAALLLVPSLALAEGDQNTNTTANPNGWYNHQGQWQNNNNQQRRHGRRDDRHDRDDNRDNRGNHYGWDNGRGNPHNGTYNGNYNGGYNGNYNGAYGRGNGAYGGYGSGNYGGGYGGNRLGGQVSSFSPYNLYLSNGTHVELHDGTIINPTGATPQPGQRVQVSGHWNSDRTFAADEIDIR